MKKYQFEEIVSGIGLIAVLISYSQFGMNWLTIGILVKFVFDTRCVLIEAWKSGKKLRKDANKAD